MKMKQMAWIVGDVCRRIGMAWRVQHQQQLAKAKRGGA